MTAEDLKFRLDILNSRYREGLRVKDLGDQPALWFLRGLQKLERGGTLTEKDIENFDKAGGTDHPDPFVSTQS